ncbi:MAG TPA: metallophosphoesterase [Verrucomicrobiae bacterium]|nr:metallophosphoesterase [Verrucomicrobiae bacterium]
MRFQKFSRRKFIATLLLATPVVALADARLVEPDWLKVRRLKVGTAPTHRLVHFSDLHHKGDRDYLESVVKTINGLAPDFVCFTGDIIENAKFLPEALEILSGIRSPMFGVPGNHDFWSGISFAPVQKCFSATGGEWLMGQHHEIAGGKINLVGIPCLGRSQPLPPTRPEAKNILLMHYPAWVKNLGDRKFDLMLAGHSHGGQVRIPFYGAVVVPFSVDEYDMGLFQTSAGPLYVNPGIGYLSGFEFRFNCRPEITVIEI